MRKWMKKMVLLFSSFITLFSCFLLFLILAFPFVIIITIIIESKHQVMKEDQEGKMEEKVEEGEWYFAIGSNMEANTMEKRRNMKVLHKENGKVLNHTVAFEFEGFPFLEPVFALLKPLPPEKWFFSALFCSLHKDQKRRREKGVRKPSFLNPSSYLTFSLFFLSFPLLSPPFPSFPCLLFSSWGTIGQEQKHTACYTFSQSEIGEE